MSLSAKMPETRLAGGPSMELKYNHGWVRPGHFYNGTSQPFPQWHITLQVDKQHDIEKLKGLNATSQTPVQQLLIKGSGA